MVAHTHKDIRETGEALAQAAFDRGDVLTPSEHRALAHWSRWGSDSYPVLKLKKNRGWIIEHEAGPRYGRIFKRKADAVEAWEILIQKWIRLKALHQHADDARHRLEAEAAEQHERDCTCPDCIAVEDTANTEGV